jgi:hypothetical protein
VDDPDRADSIHILVGARELYRLRLNDPDARLEVGAIVDPQQACEIAGWGAESPRCKAALEYLEEQHALERSDFYWRVPSGPTAYVWGTGAAAMLGEA